MPPKRDTYPQRLRPPERVRAQWRRRGRAIGERGYSQRWAAFWKRVVLVLQKQGTWRDHDIELVAGYVKRCRLAELHAEEAELDPYPVNPDSKMLRVHPGWERSLAEAREARQIAGELHLTPRARHAARVDIPDPTSTGGDDPPRGPAWSDDQQGPDGAAL